MSFPKITDVFVAGGLPTVTYIPRAEHGLEKVIHEYLEARHKILSISGQTKSGKTVLVRKVVPRTEAVWISGGSIIKPDNLWEMVLDQLGGYTVIGSSKTQMGAEEHTAEGALSIKPGGVGYDGKLGEKTAESVSKTQIGSRTVSSLVRAVDRLIQTKTPLVIDDFHYIDKESQLIIVRGLKDAVFEGVPVVLVSVPHRAFDAVRVEKEMTGRVQQLPIPEWGRPELEQIPMSGFHALNADCATDVVGRLVEESFGSPHLMQDFCLALARNYSFSEEERAFVSAPADWSSFFRLRAADASKSAFDRLAQGPRQRTSRMDRTLRNGDKCDIYNAVLLAIAWTGPKTRLTYEDLREGLNNVLVDQIPQAQEVTRVLEKMSEIAQEHIQGEPVVDWDKEFSTLHVSDPFFAYYLRWGVTIPK